MRAIQVWVCVGGVLLGAMAWILAAPLLDRRYDALPPDGFNGLSLAMELFAIVASAALAGALVALTLGIRMLKRGVSSMRRPQVASVYGWTIGLAGLGLLVAFVPAILAGSTLTGLIAVIVPALCVALGVRLGFGSTLEATPAAIAEWQSARRPRE